MQHWWLAASDAAPDAEWRQHALLDCQPHGKGLIVSLEGVADRTAAENLTGWYVAAPREALPAPKAGEFYWGDLIGLAVTNVEGEALGEVAALLSTGAHDVLQVRDGDTERLIPFVAAYVTEVDPGARRIRVDWQKDW